MNKNANSADVRRLTRASRKAGKSLVATGKSLVFMGFRPLRLEVKTWHSENR